MGSGTYSDALYIYSAKNPEPIKAATVEYSGINIFVNWNESFLDYGHQIYSY